jgi:hypothetical protein
MLLYAQSLLSILEESFERLLAELDALEWLQAQIAVFTLENRKAVGYWILLLL